jgi:hypothetical protein
VSRSIDRLHVQPGRTAWIARKFRWSVEIDDIAVSSGILATLVVLHVMRPGWDG